MKAKTIALLALGATAAFASADTLVHTYTFDEDTDSFGGYGSANNVVIFLDLNTIFAGYQNFEMSGAGWDVTLEAFSPSWLAEIAVEFNNSSADSIDAISLSPGIADEDPGVGSYTSGGIINFADVPLNNIALSDGVLRMELFEGFDDTSVSPDGAWLAGSTLDLQFEAEAVPEPATMTILGLGALAALRRRRKA